MKKTVVVNLFAGPGAGKTTCAWAIASELKKRNIETEYVSEYAKELVWDTDLTLLDGTLPHQKILFQEQKHRIDRLIGKVDVIVTDSPTILGLMYVDKSKCSVNEYLTFEQEAITDYKRYNNFNLFINRGKEFQQAGRIHNLEQSKKIDTEIKDLLNRNGIYYGTYYHQTLDVLVNNIMTNLGRNKEINEEYEMAL